MVVLLSCGSGLLMVACVGWVINACWHWSLTRRVVLWSVLLVSCALLWTVFRIEIVYRYSSMVGEMNLYSSMVFMTWFEYSLFTLSVWMSLYLCIKYYREAQQQRIKLLQMTSMAYQSQLKMLRYQLNPHFLFNTLNAISSLIIKYKNTTADKMVNQLADFLRTTLDTDPMQKIPLHKELNALKLYLNIERTRFEERLKLRFDVDPAVHQALIPSLLMQPLIENAIKYAISVSEDGGTLEIGARMDKDRLLLHLADTGPGMSLVGGRPQHATGVGVSNTLNRLHTIYGDAARIEFAHNRPHGLIVRISLPLEMHKRAWPRSARLAS